MEELRIEMRRIIEKLEIFSTNESLKIIILSTLLMICFMGVISFYFVFLTVVACLAITIYFCFGLGSMVNFLLISLYFYGRSIYKNFAKDKKLIEYEGHNPVKILRKKQKQIKYELKKYYILKQERRVQRDKDFQDKYNSYIDSEDVDINTWEGLCIMYCPSMYEVITFLWELGIILVMGLLAVGLVVAYLILWVIITFFVGVFILSIIL